MADILIAVTDGLKGMPEALGAVFPATTLQTCIVHLIRNAPAQDIKSRGASPRRCGDQADLAGAAQHDGQPGPSGAQLE